MDSSLPGKAGATQKGSTGQTPMAGWANRLIQYGRSSHETKTNGCFGGLQSKQVHPPPF